MTDLMITIERLIMKVYPIFLAVLALMTLAMVSTFGWLWYHNQQQLNPLPIVLSDQQLQLETPDQAPLNAALIIQIDASLKPAMTEILSQFNHRYPKIKIITSYVSRDEVFNLDHQADGQPDIIITNQSLTQSQLNALQKQADNLADLQTQHSVAKKNLSLLMPFSYAVKSQQSLEAIIITDNPVALQLRNFLLSSSGQDLLTQQGFEDIDGYKNQVDDLFNPKMNINSKSNTALDLEGVLEDRR